MTVQDLIDLLSTHNPAMPIGIMAIGVEGGEEISNTPAHEALAAELHTSVMGVRRLVLTAQYDEAIG